MRSEHPFGLHPEPPTPDLVQQSTMTSLKGRQEEFGGFLQCGGAAREIFDGAIQCDELRIILLWYVKAECFAQTKCFKPSKPTDDFKSSERSEGSQLGQ